MAVTVLHLLKRLGLPKNESKTLAYLYQSESATASEIANDAAIPRTKCYVCLRSLVGKGLVFEIPSKPKKFKAVPIETLQSIVIDQNKHLSQIKPLKFTASPVFLTLGQKNVMRLFPVETAKCKKEII
ncbi:MAG: helix-turn-helix domain-containing protein, partial [Candidatus Micrarchaeota archaeon]|nr:helix-turn-helix domain-containing protein [Candidatus Micrarchaeota archaeon]